MIKKDPFEIDASLANIIIFMNFIIMFAFSFINTPFIISDYENKFVLFLLFLFLIGIFFLRKLVVTGVAPNQNKFLGVIVIKGLLSYVPSIVILKISFFIFDSINFNMSKSNPLIVCNANVEILVNNSGGGTWLEYELNNFSGSRNVKTTDRLIELSKQPASSYYLKLHGRKGFFNSFCVEKYSIEEVKSKQ